MTRQFSIVGALNVGLAGAFAGGVFGWVVGGGNGPTAIQGNYGWGEIMAPIFAMVGAIFGLAYYLVFVAVRAIAIRIEGKSSTETLRSSNLSEWENPANWFAGLIYHSRRDSRTFVPKRVDTAHLTINFSRPPGIIVATVLGALIFVMTFVYVLH